MVISGLPSDCPLAEFNSTEEQATGDQHADPEADVAERCCDQVDQADG